MGQSRRQQNRSSQVAGLVAIKVIHLLLDPIFRLTWPENSESGLACLPGLTACWQYQFMHSYVTKMNSKAYYGILSQAQMMWTKGRLCGVCAAVAFMPLTGFFLQKKCNL